MDSKGERLQLFDRINGEYDQRRTNIMKGQRYSDIKWASIQLKNECKLILIACLLNCALISIKLNNHKDTVYCCKLVIKMDATNVKAFYRLAESYELQDTTTDLEMALKYIKKAKKYSLNSNKVIQIKYRIIAKKLKRQNTKDKQRFKGLFSRGSIYEDRKNPVSNKKNDRLITRCCKKSIMFVPNTIFRICTIL